MVKRTLEQKLKAAVGHYPVVTLKRLKHPEPFASILYLSCQTFSFCEQLDYFHRHLVYASIP